MAAYKVLLRLLVATVAALVVVAAAANDSTSASGSGATAAVATVVPMWATCMRANSIADMCDVQSICSSCVSLPGCAFDIMQSQCVQLPADGRAMYESSSNALLNRTNLSYCGDSDALCSSCSVSSSKRFCVGANGCVCPSMCKLTSTTQLACFQMRQNSMMFISIAVIAVMLPVLVGIQRFCMRLRGRNSGTDLQEEMRRIRQERRRELAFRSARPASAMALQLESWRTNRDQHKIEMDQIELKNFYVLMDKDPPTAEQSTSPAYSVSSNAEPLVAPPTASGVDSLPPSPANTVAAAVGTEPSVFIQQTRFFRHCVSLSPLKPMEPPASPLQRASAVVPKLHLLNSSTATASDRSLFPKIDSARPPSVICPSPFRTPCSRPPELFASQLPVSTLERVAPQRLYDASITYLDSLSNVPDVTPSGNTGAAQKPRPRPPPPHCGIASRRSNNATPASPRDEFLVLHPSLDLADENGELSQLLLSKWSLDAGEHEFASISLFCEMKLSEAQRMTSWVERPNRFFTTACCQLFGKYIQRLETQRLSPESGASAAFLRKIHDELACAIFMGCSSSNYPHCVPFFLEYKKLHRHARLLMANVENREQSAATKQKLPVKIDKVLSTRQSQTDKRLLRMLFHAWHATTTHENSTRTLKCKAFRATRKLNLSAVFRAWRIEALRRAYQRESVEYQTMLSITAASLSRKDVQIAEADSKMASMAKIIDSLTESNAQLLYRVEQLEAIAAGKGSAGLASLCGSVVSFHRSPGTQFEHMNSLTANADGKGTGTADDEKLDRANRMLLETMFGMARMVESSAIQMSKDMMDSLEHQLDGSLLQQLAEMIHADNVVKIKAEEARGLAFGASPPSTPPSVVGPPRISRKMSANVTFSNSTMLASLGKGVVAVKDLAAMPVDAFLLNWFKMNLQLSSVAEKMSDRTIKNFTSDLADGRRFSFLLHRLFPTWFDANMVHEIDADDRLKNVASFHARVQPVLPQVVTSDSIHSGSATENIAFTAMLFGISVQSIRRLNLDRQREKFLNVITSWKRVRSLLLEVKRMNDNYDSLMIVHLLKEMRTCEALFKQLNAELCSIAIASNESASTLSQIAYKVLHLTWRCLHAKSAVPGAPSRMELVDERLAERVKDFTHVELSTVRQLLVNDSQYEATRSYTGGKHAVTTATPPHAVSEKEVVTRTEAVRDTLVMYCKDLHDIFKHYSASGGAGSIASMSMSEFLKFIKDCGLVTTADSSPAPATKHASAAAPVLTQPMVEFIFRASLFFSQVTPREFIVTTLDSTAASSGTTPPTDPTSVPLNAAALVLPAADPFHPDAAIASLDFGDREMVGHEFVDALLRTSAIKCPAGEALLLDDRFRDFMELHVLPNALRSQSEIFRGEVESPKVRAVFQKHKPALQRVFRYYASMHALREQQSTINLKEFFVFARDCKLVGSFVTEHTLKQVLINLQRDDAVNEAPASVQAAGDDAAMLRVDFGDFQEAIAALTEYVICNPYVPLYKRIEQFINENVLPRARQKKKGAGE